MTEDKYIKLHNGSEISDLKFNNYYVKYSNQFTSFKSIVPKVNTNIKKGAEGEWEINDDCEVEIISPRKIAIKKFKIDNWIVRRKTGPYVEGQATEIEKFGNLFKIKVTGLDYVHNNVICHTEGSDIPDGFTKAYANSSHDNWTILWWPGQYNSGDNYAKGLLIQGCINYADNQQYIDGSMHMGRAPGAMGSVEYITDGIYGVRGWGGIGCHGICIGLFGGVQTATSYLDNSNGAYRVYDISEHPIIIDLDVEDVSIPVDPSSIECWDMYLGEQQVYKRNKTVENCWLKYGFAEKVSDNIYSLTNNCSSHINQPIAGRKYSTPIVSDYKKYFTNKLISYSGDLSDITNPIMGAEYYKLYNTDNMYHSNKCTSKIWVKGEKISGKEYTKIPINTTFYTKDWVASNMQRITQYISDENGELVSSAVISIPEGALEVNGAFECNNKYYNIVTSWEEIRVTAEKPKVCGFVWHCINYNQKLWDDIRNFYANEYVINDNRLLDNIFDGSNMNGEVTLKLSLTQFSTAFRILANSNVEKLNIIVTDDNTNISSTLRMFKDASNLKEITFQNLVQPSKCLCAAHMVEDMFSGTQLLKTYPSNLIDWSNRANLKSSPGGDTAFSYFIDYGSGLATVPMCSLANGDREHDTNTIISTRIRQSLNGCTNLTYFGPTLDVIAVHPTTLNDVNECFKGCIKLTDIRIKHLNHGDWHFDGSSFGPENAKIVHGNLKSLNQESIKYLFDNACDLTKTAVNSETTPNVLNTFSSWSGDVKTQYSYCHYSIGGLSYRFLDKQMSFDDDSINPNDYLDAVAGWSTNKKFYVTTSTNGQVLDKLTVKITNLNSNDFIWFGTQDRNSGTKITINNLDSNGRISLEKNNTETYGFYLYTTDPTMVGRKLKTVTIEIVKPCNPYMSSVNSASIYCPSEWSAHITSGMVINMNDKGWNIYIGGVEQIYEKYEFVDLGLPSKLQWAKWNVGATKPEESGLYFAWGEDKGYVVTREGVITNTDGSQTRKTFAENLSDYKYYDVNSGFTKYNETDGLQTLANEDDGCYLEENAMRMPTHAEFSELIDNTTSAWTTNYNGSGVNGMTFTSKTNGNSIFVPAVGSVNSGEFIGFGTYGSLWSSSRSSSVEFATFLDFSPDYLGVGDSNRFVGYPLRAVRPRTISTN